jgi:glycosyltransferase involved in cell wall biosynthesis
MRILFAGLTPPWPPTNGQRLRNLALLRALAAEGHAVTWISFCDPGDRDKASPGLAPLCTDYHFVELPGSRAAGGRDIVRRALSLFSPRPYGARRFASNDFRESVNRRLTASSYDAIICDDIYVLPNLPVSDCPPLFLNKHDLTHVILRRCAATPGNPLARLYAFLEHLKVRRAERLACASSKAVLTASPIDAGVIRAWNPLTDLVLVPNAIDTAAYHPVPTQASASVLFFGAMDFYPNQDAARFLLAEIWPRVRSAVPEAVLVLAGRDMPERLRTQIEKRPGVRYLPDVPDMRKVVSDASVCVVPLRIGSGTRLKILEAAALARPVVSTAIGAEGLVLESGKEILIADRPGDFAAATISLLRDPDLRQRLGAAARACVHRNYDVRSVRTALATAFERIPLSPAAASR